MESSASFISIFQDSCLGRYLQAKRGAYGNLEALIETIERG